MAALSATAQHPMTLDTAQGHWKAFSSVLRPPGPQHGGGGSGDGSPTHRKGGGPDLSRRVSDPGLPTTRQDLRIKDR